MPNPNPKIPPLAVRLEALGVEPLGPEEVSASLRFRTHVAVYELVRHLTPKERGDALTIGLRALGLLREEAKDDEAQAGE